MINMLSDCDEKSIAAIATCHDKVITSITLEEPCKPRREGDDLAAKGVIVKFVDGTRLDLWDAGQTCCESRYIRTDDHLSDWVGAKFLDVEIVDSVSPMQDDYDWWDVHEIQFLRILTDKGVIVFSSHNEHNGYYGGFSIQAVVK